MCMCLSPPAAREPSAPSPCPALSVPLGCHLLSPFHDHPANSPPAYSGTLGLPTSWGARTSNSLCHFLVTHGSKAAVVGNLCAGDVNYCYWWGKYQQYDTLEAQNKIKAAQTTWLSQQPGLQKPRSGPSHGKKEMRIKSQKNLLRTKRPSM